MSDWTSKYAIMRDLAEAQGFDVPADLEGIGANEKPPALVIPEDTGDVYFEHGEGEGDCGGPPDLALIQHMLNMVRDVDISNCEDDPEQVVQISKPSNLNIGKDITHTKTGTKPKPVQINVKPLVKKVKKKRENVAVNSILLAMAADTPILNMELPKEPIILLKPTDFISDSTDKEIVQSVEKVNGWLDTQVLVQSVEKVNGWLDTQVPSTSVARCSGNPLILEPGSMFRRKTSSTVKSSGTNSIKSPSPQKQAIATIASYKPSVLPGDTQELTSSTPKASGYPLVLEPSAMFKRKSNAIVKSPESDSIISPPPQQQATATIGTYKPSMLASEYYQKYVERSKIKELQEDVWTRAERIMKEIDARKKLEAEAAEAAVKEAALLEDVIIIDTPLDAVTIDEVVTDTSVIEETVDAVRKAKIPDMLEFLQNEQSKPSRDALCREIIELPQHRHLLTGECIVCKVVTAHGYDVDAQIYGNAK